MGGLLVGEDRIGWWRVMVAVSVGLNVKSNVRNMSR